MFYKYLNKFVYLSRFLKKLNNLFMFNFSTTFLFFIVILSFFIFVNSVCASISSSDAVISQTYSGAQDIFYKLEKALLVQDDTRIFGFACKQGSFTTVVDTSIQNNFTPEAIAAWLDHTQFSRCLAELWSKGSRGKGIYGDRTTADEFCKLMGYEGVIEGSGSTGSYSSYASELTVRHNGTTCVMYPHGSGESHFYSFTCGSTSEYIEM